MESLAPIISAYLYSEVYIATKDTDVPGAPYFMSAGFSITAVLFCL